MRFEIIIPPPASASSSRLQTPKPQPPAAAGAARPATIIAKRPRGRPPRKVLSNPEKLNAIARHLHAEYNWSLKDVIRHMVVDEPGKDGDTSNTTPAITTTTQQQQQERVGALIEAIWGQPEVLSELEAHPKFPASLGKRLENNDTAEGDVSDKRSAEEENEEEDRMSVDSGEDGSLEDENEGDTSVEASAEVENEREMSVEASAEDENEGEISVDANAKNENEGEISVNASAADEYERGEISGSTQDVASAEEENPPTSGHSYSTQEEEESSEDSTSPPKLQSHPPLPSSKPTNSPPTIANNPTDSISSANILPSPHRTRGKKIDYITLALSLPPDPDDDDENDGDFALSRVSADR